MKKINFIYALFFYSILFSSCKSKEENKTDTSDSTNASNVTTEKNTSSAEGGFFSVQLYKPTDEIPPQQAKDMQDFYRKNKEHFKVKYLKDGKVIIDTLRALIFKSSELEQLINYQPGAKAKYIALYFGRNAQDVTDTKGKQYPNYTIITIGTDADGKLLSKAYDKADPCPPNCPK